MNLPNVGKIIDINCARSSDTNNRDILVDLKHYDDNLYLLHSNYDRSLKENLHKYELALYDSAYEN